MTKKSLTVTGASTLCTFPSSTSISLAIRHSALTSFSHRHSHRISLSIWESRDDKDEEEKLPLLHDMFEENLGAAEVALEWPSLVLNDGDDDDATLSVEANEGASLIVDMHCGIVYGWGRGIEP
jgi:hypothetical protein